MHRCATLYVSDVLHIGVKQLFSADYTIGMNLLIHHSVNKDLQHLKEILLFMRGVMIKST